MTQFQPFELERYMSKYEQEVEYNLSESGVHPIVLSDLLQGDATQVEELLETDLNYPHVNGTPELRQSIANLYDGANEENVLVTVGAIEANYLAATSLLQAGDELVMMLPNYMQIWGIAKNEDVTIKTFPLLEEKGWAPDLDAFRQVVSAETKLISICNPNNPTGKAMSEAEMDEIVEVATEHDAWILADEVYRGAERETDVETPSFFGRYDKVVAIGSMSKAYGMPGVRVGWMLAPPEIIDAAWARHEYVTISATMLSNKLTAYALSPEVRPRVLQRTRDYIRAGFPILQQWMADHPGEFSLNPPDASAIAFVRYHIDINSTDLVTRLRLEKSTLVVPGDYFGMDHFLRISFGLPPDYLNEALDRIHQLLLELA